MSNRSFILATLILFVIAVFAYVLGSGAQEPGEIVVTPPPSIPRTEVLPYGEVTLKVGQTAMFPGFAMTLVRVFDDSRCPNGVTCIWAGTIKAEMLVASGLGTSTPVVEIGKMLTTEAEEVTFVSATPYPEEGKNIDEGTYRLVFAVKKRVP